VACRHATLLRVLCQTAENSAYRNADHVVSMLPKVHGHMAAHGLDLRKLAIVPNGTTLDEWQGEPQPLRDDGGRLTGRGPSQGRHHRRLCGGRWASRIRWTRCWMRRALLRDEKIHFVLVGDGHLRERLQERIAQLQLPQVSLWPPIRRRRYLRCWPPPTSPGLVGSVSRSTASASRRTS
jgi:glycosyltransferase involved in cell wall biosynthesis